MTSTATARTAARAERDAAAEAINAMISICVDADGTHDDGGFDLYPTLEALRPVLPATVWEDIALAWEVCPMHLMALENCRDDGVFACINYWGES